MECTDEGERDQGLAGKKKGKAGARSESGAGAREELKEKLRRESKGYGDATLLGDRLYKGELSMNEQGRKLKNRHHLTIGLRRVKTIPLQANN